MEASAVAAVAGSQFSAVSGGVLSLVGVGLIAMALPEFRRLDMAVETARDRDADGTMAPEV